MKFDAKNEEQEGGKENGSDEKIAEDEEEGMNFPFFYDEITLNFQAMRNLSQQKLQEKMTRKETQL